ncbi:MAG: restriction endonuclease subunit S [Nitrospirae bacterium]|nr:restriction endonuclease subunit S [Candidatus Troglogloeales bacterium]
MKIENDGFDLGAQRRPNGKNDLPKALEILQARKELTPRPSSGSEHARYKTLSLRDMTGTPLKEGNDSPSGIQGGNDSPSVKGWQAKPDGVVTHVVAKGKIVESSDINLSGDRYRETAAVQSQWPMAPIGDLCELQNGRAFKPTDWEKAESGGLPIIRIQNLNNPQSEFNYFSGRVDDRLIVRNGDLLFSWSGSRGTSFGPHIWIGNDGILNQHIFNVRHNDSVIRSFFYWMLKKAVEQVEENLHGGVGLVHITKGNLEIIEIPLPPLDIQRQIVAELDGYRKIIEGAR